MINEKKINQSQHVRWIRCFQIHLGTANSFTQTFAVMVVGLKKALITWSYFQPDNVLFISPVARCRLCGKPKLLFKSSALMKGSCVSKGSFLPKSKTTCSSAVFYCPCLTHQRLIVFISTDCVKSGIEWHHLAVKSPAAALIQCKRQHLDK